MVLKEAFSAVINTVASDASSKMDTRSSYVELSATLLAFVISIVIIAFVGKWLWNEVVVELISVAKPAKSMWQVLGLFVFLSLVCPH